MRWLIRRAVQMVGAGLCALAAGTAQADDIATVLQRSQAQRLAQRPPPGDPHSPAAERVRASFVRLASTMHQNGSPPGAAAVAEAGPELVLVGGDLYAEALFGRPAVAVSEAVGDLPEGERLLLLAHELGHLNLGHWAGLSGLYRRFIPGEVTPEATTPVAAALGAQAHSLSHRQEFEADAYGFTLVRQLGFGVDNALGLLTRHGMQLDSATHPGTRRRIAQIRVLDSQLSGQARGIGGDTALVGAARSAAGD